MKTTSDVCKMIGITRKTLRGYVDIGLIQPTEKTEAGYWLYDDQSVQIIALVQLLTEYGYKRKDIIKKFKESQEIDLMDECKKAISLLEKKRERITATIDKLNADLYFMENVPGYVLNAMQEIDFDKFFQNLNFTDGQKLAIDTWNGIKKLGINIDENQQLIQAMLELLYLGLLKKKDINSTTVQRAVERFENFVWNYEIQGKDTSEIEEVLNGLTEKEFEFNMFEECMGFLEMAKEHIDIGCGSGANEFIKKALSQYKMKKPVLNI